MNIIISNSSSIPIYEQIKQAIKQAILKNELKEEDKYKDIYIRIIDKSKESNISSNYDYYYVPTFYLDDKKYHEGIVSKDTIKKLFDEVLDGYI